MLLTPTEGAEWLLAGTREFGDERLRRRELGSFRLSRMELNGFRLQSITQIQVIRYCSAIQMTELALQLCVQMKRARRIQVEMYG